MKIKISRLIMLGALILLVIFSGTSFRSKREINMLLLPGLPMPIAKEYVLITSAGQSTDAYIVNDIANKLMIHNYFMPQAKEDALEGVRTIVFVAGCSELGQKLHGTAFEDEKKRIAALLGKAKARDISILTVFIGGRQDRKKNTEELLGLVCKESDYIIGTRDEDYLALLTDLTKEKRIPVTVVNSVNDLSVPFASAFR
jgi:hypothetical protein